MRKCYTRLWTAAFTAFFIAAVPLTQPAYTQVLYGSLVGQVQDPTSGLIPNAQVTITNKSTGQQLETQTDASGRYQFNNVQPGSYELNVQAQGFRTLTRPNIDITANTVGRADVTLEVGQVTEQVTVAASAALLQTDKADVHTEIGTTAITNLPLSRYRNFQTLIDLVPGATPTRTQNAQLDTPGRSLTTNINGTPRNNNNTKVDGAQNVNIWLPHHMNYVPPAETVETVNVTTNSFDADQGMAGGAAVTVVTKSGTNDLHGAAFWYHDNQHLRARNFFLPANQEKPLSITNITGGVLGGPIVKNKLFFFGGWEGNRERAGKSGFLTVPTADVRRGDFSAYSQRIYDPATGNPDGTGRQAFPNNTIPQNRVSSVAQRTLEFVPLPNITGRDTNNYFTSGTQAMNRDNFDIKIDWNRTASNRIWGKYSAMDAQVTCPFALGEAGNNVPGCNSGTGDTLIQLATIGTTWTLSPTFLFDANIGWTRQGQSVLGFDFGTNYGSDILGIPGTNGPDVRQSGFPTIEFGTQYSSYGNTNGWMPAFRNDQSYTGSFNFSAIKGAHNIRFGYDVVRHHLNHWQPELGSGPRGRLVFGGGPTALNAAGAAAPGQYNSFATFLLGLPTLGGKSVQLIRMTAFEWQHGLYIRDRWQATQRLTLNLGLRWEYYPLMTRANGGIERYDAATNLIYLGGYGNIPKDAGVTVSKRLFAPRFGLAYRITDTTVMRAGYGITINPMPLARPLRGFYPLTVGSEFTAPNSFTWFNTAEEGIPEICCPDLSSGVLTPPGAALIRTPFEGELKRGYIQSWNFFLEQRMPADLVVAAGYVGTRVIRQFADLNINSANPFTNLGNAGRPLNQRFGRVADTLLWQGWLDSDYHALQASVNRHFANGFFFKGAYTWSKAINYTDDDGWAGLPLTNYEPALERNRALAGYDRTHMFQAAFIYELPFGQGKPYAQEGAAGAILGGWQVNGQFSAYSGTPFNVTSSAALNAPGNTQVANQVKPEVLKLGGIGPGQPYYDITAFADPAVNTWGNTGRNRMRGPGVTGLDLGVFRNFRLSERFNLQFRADAFNATNSPVFANPATNVSASTFMTITGTDNDAGRFTERQFRFGLRLAF
jgi:hypothetical protein